MEVIAAFAAPLTFRMICAILGVPRELDDAATRNTLMTTISPAPGLDPARAEGDLHGLPDILIAGKRAGGERLSAGGPAHELPWRPARVMRGLAALPVVRN
ncbi:hypothetical protein ACFC00_36650 [Streptomyces adustus]|uniref:hypothetical protein n=1 Tax=Streptomyces adustus TaxID=1609272 RepID=UPI0035D654FF